jgi:GDP-4-dehydro-6-deoxy-D-mannose reductase
MKVLITGITGFTGSHLAEYILANHPDVELHGTIRWRSRMDNVLQIQDKVTFHEADLKDMTSLLDCLAEIQPDRIFHLAAQSYVPTSWKCPSETFAINTIGEVNLFESARRVGISPRIQIAGSSEEYGEILPDELPVKETNPLRPLSPYAVSKVAQDLLAYQYFKSYAMHIVRTRGFNHTGPRRGDVFVTSAFAKQIAEIEKGRRAPVIHVGNLEAMRDFSDVRDMARAYWLSLEMGAPGEVYNIGSGVTHSIKELLEMLISLTPVEVCVEVDSKRLRPSDVPLLVADSSKFVALTGWAPQIPFQQTLRDLLDYWRERV